MTDMVDNKKAGAAPRIVVDLTGGCIHAVYSEQPVEVVFYDMDEDSLQTDDSVITMPSGDEAAVFRWSTGGADPDSIDPDHVGAVFAAVNRLPKAVVNAASLNGGSKADDVEIEVEQFDGIEDVAAYFDLEPEEMALDVEEFIKKQGLWAEYVKHTMAVHSEAETSASVTGDASSRPMGM